MSLKHFCHFFLFLAIPFSLLAQEQEAFSVFGFKTQSSFIIPHSEDLKPISGTYPLGFQVDWSKLNLSQKAWEQCNCYSKIGLSFAYFNYRNPEILGNSYNLILFAEPYLGFENRLYFTFRTGIGLTYLNQVFDEKTNPQNTFYSSPISFIVLLNLAANYRIDQQWSLNLTAHYNHISNGGISHPNKGMNFPGIGLGIDYSLQPVSFKSRQKIEVEKGKLMGYGRLFVTRKTVEARDEFPEETELLYGLAGGAILRITNFSALSTGLEIFRDNTLSIEAERRGISKSPYVVGTGIGHHFIFGRFNFNQQMVYYLYKPFDFTSKKFYQRYELAYRISNYLQVGVSLKAHGHVAENFDLRLGVIF